MKTTLFAKYLLINFTMYLLILSGQNTSAQQLQSVLIEPWVVSEHTWQTGGVEHYGYDAEGYQTDFMYSMWMSESDVFFDYSHQILTNDASGHPVEKLVLFHDYDTGVWDSGVRYSYSYDPNGNLLVDHYETHAEGVWTPFSRDVNQYDSNNRITVKTSQQWDMYLLIWKNMMQNVYTYHPDGTLLDEIYQNWDTELHLWIPTHRDVYTYNNVGKPLTKTTQWLDETIWQPMIITSYTYNDANQCITSVEQSGGPTSWTNYMRLDYTHNTDGSLAQSVRRVWRNNEWENHYRRTYFYNVLEAEQFETSTKLLLYPNPANDFVNTSGTPEVEDYVITDNLGRTILSGRLLNEEQKINLSTLPTGVYFLINGKKRLKILKQ